MRLHIVQPYGSIAMQRMTVPLQSLSSLYEVTTSAEIDPSADVNIHAPWRSFIGQERGTSKHVIMYTHCNPTDMQVLYDACNNADVITCMSWEGRRELIQLGVDPTKLHVVYAAADNFKFKRKVIGIVGVPQPNGRKRENLILDLAWKYDLTPFQFVYVGTFWDRVIEELKAVGVNAESIALNDEGLQMFYQQIDALLVTGYAEGGPLPLLEALAVGIPVISPRFGYAADLLDSHYDTVEDLWDALSDLAKPAIFSHQLSRAWSWLDYVNEYAMILGRLTDTSTEIFPDFATDRYSQILDVMDEMKPSSIVEIGTWNGNRALQMIQQAAKYQPIQDVFYQGFDLFDSMTGEQFRRELSKQGQPIEVVRKRLEATGAEIELFEGDTKHTLDELIDADFYFVDGGHSEKTIKNDADYVLDLMKPESVVIFDDYYHEGKPAGVGCNKVIDAFDRNLYEVTHLPVRTKAEDGRVIGMVKVRKYGNLYLRMHEQTQSTAGTCNDGNSAYFVSYVQPTHAQSTAN